MSGQRDQGLSPRGATHGIGFQDMPPEIRQKIWKEATPPTVLTFFADSNPASADRGDAWDISQVNAESRATVQHTHFWRVNYETSQLRQSIQINPIHVVVFIKEGRLPPHLGDGDGRVPLQKIASIFRSLNMVRSIDYTMVPLGKLKIDGFDNIREYTILSEFTEDVWIGGCQMYEPQVVGVDPGFIWYRNFTQDPDALDQAARYFERKGIPGDTGIKWPSENFGALFQATNLRGWRLLEEWIAWRTSRAERVETEHGIAGSDYSPTYGFPDSLLPRIGHMGYSMNGTSVGGNWAGFRYFTDTMRVEFTPLAFADIEGVLRASRKARGVLPELAMHIWVIRPGEEGIAPNESYHAWEVVRPYSETEHERDGQIRRLWQLARDVCDLPNNLG